VAHRRGIYLVTNRLSAARLVICIVHIDTKMYLVPLDGRGQATNQNLKPTTRTTVGSVKPGLKMYVVKSTRLWETPARNPR
jgi:hypothetical protein